MTNKWTFSEPKTANLMGPNKRPTIPYPYPQPANHKPIPNNPNPKKKQDRQKLGLFHTQKNISI